MATITICRAEGVVVVDMAGSAGRRGRRHMRSRQGKPRGAVIERCRRPTYRRMACCAVGGRKSWPGRGVHRIIRLLPSRQMAA